MPLIRLCRHGIALIFPGQRCRKRSNLAGLHTTSAGIVGMPSSGKILPSEPTLPIPKACRFVWDFSLVTIRLTLFLHI